MVDVSVSLILSLKLDQAMFDLFDRLRQQHFPTEKNFLSAHVTLFHKLPGEHEAEIQQTLHAYCSRTATLSLTCPSLRSLGQGVAVDVECEALVQLRQQLAQNWHDYLSRQDQQRYQPHITIQNKVPRQAAQQLHNQLAHRWKPLMGRGEGLLLWYYRGGPWELVREFPFGLD
ncbi:MAG: 2'-5' RNA ligase family protein [Leptolyngbyaceae cyanobacterium bins.302]|nr:2'-5' RNA ligase family protein [Leptolyngbyaceae cyanobacterium bins.302]